MTTLAYRSFSSGEISPSLYARADLTKYATGLRTCKNNSVLRYGGTANRAGTSFIGEVSDSSDSSRLIPFIFNSNQTYVLEFGDYYMRVMQNGLHLTETATVITGVTQADPAVMTITAHGYSDGDEVYINSVAGMIELNNRNFKVSSSTANTFELQLMNGTGLDSTGYTAYVSGGTSEKLYEIVTQYAESEVSALNYVQSADIITLAHPSHPPAELARTGDMAWTLSDIAFQPTTDKPTAIASTQGGSGSETYRYKVSAISETDSEESLPGIDGTPLTITAITQADPAVVTITGHGLTDNDEIFIDGIVGMTELNNQIYFVDNVTANDFELVGVDSTGYGAWISGGIANRVFTELTSAAVPTTSAPHVVSWTKVDGATSYNIYKETNGVYGQIGVASGTSFDDINITPNTSFTPPSSRNPFIGEGNYPSVVTYIQQRLAFAAPDNDTERVDLSRVANFKNFTKSKPSQDDDAITFNMVGRQVNEVESMVDLGRLVILTTGGEWSAAGNDAGIIKPTDINTKQYSYNGSGPLSPIVIDGSAIYQQARGSIIRDLGYDINTDGYKGNDLTIFSAHLFDKYTIVDWSFQQIPHSILWVVRSDGTLLGLTLVRSQEVVAWHRHDLGGLVKNVCVIPEGNEDVVYVTVEREIDGETRKYIEKISTRQISLIEDSKFMDSNLTYDGRNTGSTTMTLSGGTTWEYTESLTLTSSASFFASTDVGNSIFMRGSSDEIVRCQITAYTGATEVTVKPHKTVPEALRTIAITNWDKAVDQVGGLWHLEGKEVAIFGDGFVVASPNNVAYDKITVENGLITLDKQYAVIHVGLPYYSDIETLDIDLPEGETLADKAKNVSEVTLFIEDTRGIWIGGSPPTDDDSNPLEGLTELKIRDTEDYDSPVSLTTDNVSVNIRPEWNSNGRVFIRQIDPIPMTILSVNPSGKFPTGG